MKTLLVTTLALAIGLSTAIGQTSAPATSTVAAAEKQSGKEARQKCRADAIAKGLKGDARKTAVQECFAQARPDRAAAQKCRQDGKAQNLDGKELKKFVKECRAKG